MQTKGNLVILRILEPPMINEMAHWTFENNGLWAQGFSLPDKGAVRAIMTLMYRHMEANMTKDDERDMGFGVIFVEHILSK